MLKTLWTQKIIIIIILSNVLFPSNFDARWTMPSGVETVLYVHLLM